MLLPTTRWTLPNWNWWNIVLMRENILPTRLGPNSNSIFYWHYCSTSFTLLIVLMQTIRLSRWWRKNLPFFRIVLTDHRKPVKSWYTDVLWRYNPLRHESEVDTTKMLALIANGTHVSSRVAKLAYNKSKDETFKKFFVISNVIRQPKNVK